MKDLTVFMESSIINVCQRTIYASEKYSYFVGKAYYSVKRKLRFTYQILHFWYNIFEEMVRFLQARWFCIIIPSQR